MMIPKIPACLAHRVLLLSLTLICIVPLSHTATQAQVLKWDIEATIIEIEDPDMILPDVRLGDPVRGFLSYDLSALPDDEIPNDIFYEHAPPFEVAGIVIENPRDGSELGFLPDTELPALVQVTNDGEDELVGPFDGIIALQPVLPPDGLPGFFPPFAAVDLFGPPDILSDANLPSELHLDDWPDASIVYLEIFSGTFIFAEISALTPVVPEPSTLALFLAGTLATLHFARYRR